MNAGVLIEKRAKAYSAFLMLQAGIRETLASAAGAPPDENCICASRALPGPAKRRFGVLYA
jgi:hypothetical protein